MPTSLRESTWHELRRIAEERQRTGRLPGLYAGVARSGSLVWGQGLGVVELGSDRAPSADDQFLIASNTKTFVAVMVLQLRDEGRLDLDDTIARHLPGVTQPTTIRQGLTHLSGLRREPTDAVWDTLEQPDDPELLAGFNAADRVGRPLDRWHYSNLLFAILGQLVAHLDGRSWAESLQARLLDPLEMRRTSVGFDGGPHAHGYYVPPYHDVPRAEPVLDLRAMDPCGGLASTPNDLARWSAFIASPPNELLSPDTMEEMCQPQALMDLEGWTSAMGLGFFLVRSGAGRTWVGHTGGMPGHITGVFTHRESGTGGIVAMTNSVSPDPAAFAIELGDLVVEREPVPQPPWTPGSSVPEELRGLLGVWFSEGKEFVFSVRQGRLEARAAGAPAEQPPSLFEQIEPDVHRTVSGRERGELLTVLRGPDGRPIRLGWAGYPVTREPLGFGEEG